MCLPRKNHYFHKKLGNPISQEKQVWTFFTSQKKSYLQTSFSVLLSKQKFARIGTFFWQNFNLVTTYKYYFLFYSSSFS